MKMNIGGFFKVDIKRADGTEETTGWFKNLITDDGLDQLIYGRTSGQGINTFSAGAAFLGQGTGAPAVTDNQSTLVNSIKSTQYSEALPGGTSNRLNAGANVDAPTTPGVYEFAYVRRRYEFVNPAISGNAQDVNPAGTWTEVAIGIHSGTNAAGFGGFLWSRTLLPAPLVVTANDIVNIAYEVRVYPDLNDFTGSFILDGNTYNYTGRPSGFAPANSWAGMFDFPSSILHHLDNQGFSQQTVYSTPAALGPYTGQISTPSGTHSGSSNSTSTRTVGAYTQGSFSRTFKVGFGLNEGNVVQTLAPFTPGIKGMRITLGWLSWQLIFDNPIPKDNTKTLEFYFTLSWNRI